MAYREPAMPTRHAVILAAGESKRTRPLTLQRPKPLIPLLDRPLLAHILDELVGLVERVTLVVGYRADQIAAAFGASYCGIELRYRHQTVMNGTAGALLAAGPIDEPFLLIYGDNLVAREDLLGVCRGRYGVAGLRVEDARSFGVLEIADGEVRRIIEKPAVPPPGALANPGIYRFDGAVFPLVERIAPSPRGELELTDLIAALAEAGQPALAHECSGHWVPVGTPWEALSAALFLLARRAGAGPRISQAAEVHPHCEIEGAVTIGRARIGAARIVGPALIGDGCVIGDEALIVGSALGPGSIVGHGAVVADTVLGAGVAIGAGAQVSCSWLDDAAQVGRNAVLPAAIFDEVRPTAEVRGLLTRELLLTRGAVLAAGATVPEGTTLAPGSMVEGLRD